MPPDGPPVDRLRAALVAAGADPSPRELAEVLWLAGHVRAPVAAEPVRPTGVVTPTPAADPGPALDLTPPPAPPVAAPARAPEPAVPLHLPAGDSDGAPGAGVAGLLAPAAPALGPRLPLQRALRPLARRVPDPRRYVVDEAATADNAADGVVNRTADRRVWLPVVRPASRRWLDLALVLDTGPSMAMWHQLLGELRQALIESGTFRNVTVWELHGDLLVPAGGGSHRDAAALVRPDGRQVTLVVSDCSGPAWHAGGVAAMLHRLGGHGPVAILQPLPERLWERTAAPATVGRLTAPSPCAPNVHTRFSAYDGLPNPAPGDVVVPVLELRPEWLAGWAGLVASGAPLDPAAVAYVAARGRAAVAVPEPDPVPPPKLVREFRAGASPTAVRLMRCLATTTPAVPLMHLIQRTVIGHTAPGDLAEIVLSGLLTPVAGVPGRYAFLPGVREALLDGLGRADAASTVDLLTRVSERIERDAGTATRAFRALIPDPDGRPGAATGAFALISPTALRRLYPAGEHIHGTADRPAPVAPGPPTVHIGHTGGVRALATITGPDGRTLLASASDDGTIRLWDPATGDPVGAPLTGHEGAVHALVTLDLDRRPVLASASIDQTVRLWDPTTGELRESSRFLGRVRSLATTTDADGRRFLLAATGDDTVHRWQPTTDWWDVVRLNKAVVSVAATVIDGRQVLVLGGQTGMLGLHNIGASDDAPRPVLPGHAGRVTDLAVLSTSDGPRILSAGNDSTVRITDPRTGSQRVLTGHEGAVQTVHPLPDGTFASAGEDMMVRYWAADGSLLRVEASGHTAPVTAIATVPVPDGSHILATASLDRTIRRRPLAVRPPATADDPLAASAAYRELMARTGRESVSARLDRVLRAALAAGTPPNLVFTGNRGTGKSTTARLVGTICHDLGLLSRGEPYALRAVDLDRSDPDRSARAVREEIEGAVGGMLYIQHADRLRPEPQLDGMLFNDDERPVAYPEEILRELAGRLEVHSGQLAVVLSGRSERIAEVLRTGGLGDHFPEPNRVEFPDYDPEFLLGFVLQSLSTLDLTVGDEVLPALRARVERIHADRSIGFDNQGSMRALAWEIADRRSRRVGANRPHGPIAVEDIPGPEWRRSSRIVLAARPVDASDPAAVNRLLDAVTAVAGRPGAEVRVGSTIVLPTGADHTYAPADILAILVSRLAGPDAPGYRVALTDGDGDVAQAGRILAGLEPFNPGPGLVVAVASTLYHAEPAATPEWQRLAAVELSGPSAETVYVAAFGAAEPETDPLTGLPRRHAFGVEAARVLASEPPGSVALLLLDLDEFSDINDGMGHDVGDEVLVAVAARLSGAVHARELLGRIRGDEFAALVTGLTDPESAADRAHEFLATLEEPVTAGGSQGWVTASVGIAVPSAGQTVEELLVRAEFALHRAKTDRGSVVVYEDDDLRPGPRRRRSHAADLDRSLANDEFTVLYRPIVDLASGEPVAVEALVGWRHPERGLLAASEFMPAVDRSPSLKAFTDEVLGKALAVLAAHGDLTVEVPVSGGMIRSEAVFTVPARLAEHGARGSRLILGITAADLHGLPDRLLTRLARLRRMGVQVALDLGPDIPPVLAFRNRQVDIVKINGDAQDAVLAVVVEQSLALGMRTLATGVETAERRDAVRRLGIHLAQGPFFGGPVPLAEVGTIVPTRRQARKPAPEVVEPRPTDRVDVLVMTSRWEEFTAVRMTFLGPATWSERDPGTDAPYLWGRYRTADGRQLSMALVDPTHSGSWEIGPVAERLADRLRPSCLALCGVCAGDPEATAPGDVIVASRVYEMYPYEYTGDHRRFDLDPVFADAIANLVPDGLPSNGLPSDVDALLWALERLRAGEDPLAHRDGDRYLSAATRPNRLEWLESADLITRRSDGTLAMTDAGAQLVRRRSFDDVEGPARLPFRVLVAPMASGSGMVAEPETWVALREAGLPAIAAVDLDAAAVASAAHRAGVPRWLVVKGVMDHVGPNFSARYTTFAARAATEVLFDLLDRVDRRGTGGRPVA